MSYVEVPAMQEAILDFYPKAVQTILKICFKGTDSDAVKLSFETLAGDNKFSLVEMFLRQQLRDGCDGYGYFDVTKMYKYKLLGIEQSCITDL